MSYKFHLKSNTAAQLKVILEKHGKLSADKAVPSFRKRLSKYVKAGDRQ